MKVLMSLNSLANRCGYFFNNDLKNPSGPSVNNGYNCSHPDCEEVQDGIGCCYSFSCPLAYSADGLVCSHAGVECEDCGNENCECDEGMMVCEIPDEKFDVNSMWLVPEDVYKNIQTNETETEQELWSQFSSDAKLEEPELTFAEWLSLEGWKK